MGRGKRSVLASLFGLKKQSAGGKSAEEEAAGRPPQPKYYQGTRVRPSDGDDDDYGGHWYADRDIDRRASEFIERVHRGMLAGDRDG
ncbi:hypothetical protein GQ55_5G404100 [Panicum hallii var. hallii]|jgi:hypothetical protein|uniref:Uncharacterized protein n=3 Tax=Panicum sect. Panicum TaxID=2100772 RepID=A0A3L6R5N4_PANMI|nr:uncharacterized protein LOC112895824 [Panicum hallii]PAN31198.1 hypothetical protein PAHAL_5G403600 [Panicum hallii]PUZ57136.1 hypothetical protein GQ55_5G404100 [Panicum hallii var. hallii]RLM94238.1 uncharacterized protein C2845_PM08G10630 [Panicum miliaceum]